MIDFDRLAHRFEAVGLGPWADAAAAQLRESLEDRPHGDWARWRAGLDALPALGDGRVGESDGALWLRPTRALDPASRDTVRQALLQMHPWRKGPYRVDDLLIDTEWRSDWKWQRIAPHIASLKGRLVLDVGCGNGYHAWRAGLEGARFVVGIDPTAVFFAQFLAISRLAASLDPDLVDRVHLQPVGIEAVPSALRCFDTVFSMGVLYHRRSPVDHLAELREALRIGGQLVLETLVIDGAGQSVLVPTNRYAKMRNVWINPKTELLQVLLERVGFGRVRAVDVSVTTCDEQRSTEWMTFESLADFLDPADSGLTIEGYPAPRRAVLIAEAER